MPIASYVPLIMFAVLFGMSTDYEVFLISQIFHAHAEGMDTFAAVRTGVGSSARVITAAALIMVTVFASFVLTADPIIKEFGIGLSIAILLDATIVRLVIVPATMVLLGEWNWWLPRWLQWLPRVDLPDERAGATAPSGPAAPPGRPTGRPRPPSTEPAAPDGSCTQPARGGRGPRVPRARSLRHAVAFRARSGGRRRASPEASTMDIIVQHTVRDYDEWKPAFDEHEPTRAKYGCTGHTIYRDSDDPNQRRRILHVVGIARRAQSSSYEDPSLTGGDGEGRRHLRAAGHHARRGRDPRYGPRPGGVAARRRRRRRTRRRGWLLRAARAAARHSTVSHTPCGSAAPRWLDRAAMVSLAS